MAATTTTATMMPMIAPVDMPTSVRCQNRISDSPGYAALNRLGQAGPNGLNEPGPREALARYLAAA